MSQEKIWDKEYSNPVFLTKKNEPQADVLKFVKFIKKEKIDIENYKVLDLGSGTGRNSFYFAKLGADVSGVEISKTAIDLAKKQANDESLHIKYIKQSMGDLLPFEPNSFDLLLDVTSSNSLNEKEREVYLSETNRVLKKNGYFFTKALCKEGDENAKNLLKNFPGKEKDTYIMPETKIIERVWVKEDFISTYQKYFNIIKIDKKTSYSKINNRSYKRNFWIAYMKK
ncbi:MAG: class I SAM-dependent methyltransferase [Candidatus Paceibacterota bacterium]